MVTIQDVAELAGVSISTVSNVLNKKKYVSEPLQERVYEAVAKLNYVRDSVASTMKLGYTRTIGIITSDICGLFYPYVIKGIYEVFSRQGYNFTIFDSHVMGNENGLRKEMESFQQLFSNRVDGVIFVSNISRSKEKAYIETLKEEACRIKPTPLVSVERDFSKYGVDSVYYDNVKTAKLATKHLIDCGCKNIAHISGPANEQIPKERTRGYLEALKECHVSPDRKDLIIPGDYTHQSGYWAMNLLLEKQVPIDGVYAANDQMAIGAIKLLHEKKIIIPDQIKVIGTDDVFVSSVTEPSLSSVHIKKKRMGKRAAEILLGRIEKSQGKIERTGEVIADDMETELIVRKSTDANAAEDKSLMDW